jgi:hypothetical protein
MNCIVDVTTALVKFGLYLQKKAEEAPTQVVTEPFDLSQEEEEGKIVGHYFPYLRIPLLILVYKPNLE